MISLRTTQVLLTVLALLLLAAGCETRSETAAPPGTSPVTTMTTVPVRQVTASITPATVVTEVSEPIPEITAPAPAESAAAGAATKPGSYHPEYIRMDAITYRVGEVVQFYLVNRGTEISGCDYAHPAYTVYQIFPDGTQRKVSGNTPGVSYQAVMTGDPSTATGPISFNSAGMLPGRYLIRFDCGNNVAREFVIQAKMYVNQT